VKGALRLYFLRLIPLASHEPATYFGSKPYDWETMKRTTWLTLLLALLGTLPTRPAHAAPPVNSASVVEVSAKPSYNPAAPGLDFWVAVVVKIQDGWHINAVQGLPEGFVPFSLKDAKGQEAVGLRAPPGIPKILAGSNEAFPVYAGSVTVFVPVQVTAGTHSLRYQLEIQACNDHLCLAPAQVKIDVPIRTLTQGTAQPANLDWFASLPSLNVAAEPENLIAGLIRQKGWWLTFLLILLGGLALNLTPCVYPMIPLTVAYFGTRTTDGPWKMFMRAVAYVLGISVTYTVLGVTAALTGRLFGSALQSTWVLAGISTVLVGLSLSMFGLYEIQAPSWLLNKIGGSQASGVLGALVMGLVFGVVAAPCVDPFSIGLLTFVAAKADPWLGFAMFFTLSLGLGFPYLLLGFFSGGIQRLPKSGLWMVWVKKVFGFILLGMPLYFLHPLLPEGVLRWVLPAYLMVVGVLLGRVFAGSGVHRTFMYFQKSLGFLLAVAGVLVFTFWPKPAHLPFEPYQASRLEAAAKAGQPILLDFSADWCIPCKELELKTFTDPQVRKELEKWVLLKADLTKFGDESILKLRDQWKVSGVPTLILIGRDGKELSGGRTVGYLSPGDLLIKLQSVP